MGCIEIKVRELPVPKETYRKSPDEKSITSIHRFRVKREK